MMQVKIVKLTCQANLFAASKHAVMPLSLRMTVRQPRFLWQIFHLLANTSQLVIARAVATTRYVSELHRPGG